MAMQVEHKTEKGTVLFVKLPDDAIGIYLTNTIEYGNCLTYKWNDEPCLLRLSIDGNWQLIGLTNDITEEQAKMIIDRLYFAYATPKPNYANYMDEFSVLSKATDSFKSLMQHLQVYEVNPLGVRPIAQGWEDWELEDLEDATEEWEKINEKVGKWLVLFKPEI